MQTLISKTEKRYAELRLGPLQTHAAVLTYGMGINDRKQFVGEYWRTANGPFFGYKAAYK
jgi:hypothetical protein